MLLALQCMLNLAMLSDNIVQPQPIDTQPIIYSGV